ncbi:MAG: outer membrane lipoprotein-sorting protein [Candidatus Cloacimonetes bacterium]|nr:outer membrane lipoprotein-sorting protein [Candidatus Cloacimonadota bacterium]
MSKNTFSHRFSRWVVANPLKSIFISVVIFFTAVFGLKFMTVENDFRYWFGQDNPYRIAFEELQNVYTKDDGVQISIANRQGDLFNKKTLGIIQELTTAAWQVPYSTRVDSITNFQYTKATGDDLEVRDLVREEDLAEFKLSEALTLKSILLDEPRLYGRVISKNFKVTAVDIKTYLPGKSPFEAPEVGDYAINLVKGFEKKYPNHEFHLSGLAMMNHSFNEAGMKDMMTLTPLMYIVIVFLMIILFKSIYATIATFVIIVMSVMAGMGFAGWVGIPITPPVAMAPTIILTLAIADSIHIIKSFFDYLNDGSSKVDAVIEALTINLQAVFLTSFTTAIGFLSMNFSDTPPYNDLGNVAAAGVGFAFIFSIFVLPTVLNFFPIKAQKKSKESSFFKKLGGFVYDFHKPVFIVSLGVALGLSIGITKFEINDKFIEYFDESFQFRRDSEYLLKNLTGIYQINYSLGAKGSEGISDPEYLQKLEEFTTWYRTVPGVVHVSSLSDTYKRLNQNMHADIKSEYKLPREMDLASQYLLLYEMSLPYGLDLNNQINVDKSSTRMIITLGDVSTKQILEIASKGEQWLRDNAPNYMHALASSPTVMFSHITERNVKSMVVGLGLAFLLITISLFLAIRDVKYGVISLIPNILPAAVAFGIWGYLKGEADFSIAVVGSMSLGIIVDDTVHFLTKYVSFRKGKNMSTKDALIMTLDRVGPAIFLTTVILVSGFYVLSYSPFKLNAVMGGLTAITIAVALIFDFLLLPATLAWFDQAKENSSMSILKPVITTGLVLAFVSQTVTYSAPTFSEDLVKKGYEVAKFIDERDMGFVNQVSDSEMILRNKHGQTSTRKMKIKILELNEEGKGDKSLVVFNHPRAVKGTAFLSFSKTVKPDDQWIFLPALKRVKRIASNNKSGPFMGSEFAYEDISSQDLAKYSYNYVREESKDGSKVHVFERVPRYKNSGYTKQVVWADEKEWRVHKIEFYDRKSSLLKTLTFSDYKQYKNGKWRPDLQTMINHQTGKSTKLTFLNYKFNQKLKSNDFTSAALKRVR